jgi:hypothetical protein
MRWQGDRGIAGRSSQTGSRLIERLKDRLRWTELAGLPQGLGKSCYGGKTLFGLLGQRPQHHSLHLGRNRGHTLAQWGRRQAQVLHHHLAQRAFKGTRSAQPLVDHYPQRVLVTGGSWVAFDLLRSHIR